MLAGGHAPGMRQYLGSPTLREKVASYWALSRPVGAICHGVLVLARTRRTDGRSLISDCATTCLPRYMERGAFWLTAWKLGHYYRTYPSYVEDEVRGAFGSLALCPGSKGPPTPRHGDRRPSGVHRPRRQLPLGAVAR